MFPNSSSFQVCLGTCWGRRRELDRPGARSSSVRARARKPWALSQMTEGGERFSPILVSLTPGARVHREPDLAYSAPTLHHHHFRPTFPDRGSGKDSWGFREVDWGRILATVGVGGRKSLYRVELPNLKEPCPAMGSGAANGDRRRGEERSWATESGKPG
jgi:hypothetical protein